MAKIKGITVILVDKEFKGYDELGKELYDDVEKEIKNVLVAPINSNDIVNQLNLSSSKAVYTLAIPKNDSNNWENKEVIFWDKKWVTVGIPLQGIDELIPLDWNKKVVVERYE